GGRWPRSRGPSAGRRRRCSDRGCRCHGRCATWRRRPPWQEGGCPGRILLRCSGQWWTGGLRCASSTGPYRHQRYREQRRLWTPRGGSGGGSSECRNANVTVRYPRIRLSDNRGSFVPTCNDAGALASRPVRRACGVHHVTALWDTSSRARGSKASRAPAEPRGTGARRGRPATVVVMNPLESLNEFLGNAERWLWTWAGMPVVVVLGI